MLGNYLQGMAVDDFMIEQRSTPPVTNILSSSATLGNPRIQPTRNTQTPHKSPKFPLQLPLKCLIRQPQTPIRLPLKLNQLPQNPHKPLRRPYTHNLPSRHMQQFIQPPWPLTIE